MQEDSSDVSQIDQQQRALLKLAPGRRMTRPRIICVAILIIVYILEVVGFLLGVRFLSLPHQWLLFVDKPLPVATLIAILPVYAEYNRKTIMYAVWICVGLICCLVGDIVLMFRPEIPYISEYYHGTDSSNNSDHEAPNAERDDVFITGMICYMLGKLFYSIAFSVGISKYFRFKLMHSVPFYAFGALVITLVYSKIGDHFALIVIYVFVECTMGWRALALTSSFPGSDRARLLLWLSVVGGAMLMASDTLMIYNYYYLPLKGANYYSTGTYYLAQIMITFSVPRRLTNSDYWLDHFSQINPLSFIN